MLDHIGKPAIKAGLHEPWRRDLKELASLPNVHCKISGVANEADHKAWTREQLKPYIAHAIECFGFERVMYGGDWHVAELAIRYPEWVEIVDWVTEGASADEKRKLFRDNCYRLLSPRRLIAMTPEKLKRAAYNVAEMRRLAQRTLPRLIFDFADGGAEDEWSLRRNESAFDDIQLMPQTLRGAATRDLSVELFGKTLKLPVMIGPTGLAGLLWPGAELCSARAAAAAGTAFCPQPRLGLHDRGHGGNECRAALHAGLRLSRPRADARVHRAGAGLRL